jgi:DNA-binding GntR family transcriptional regulator
LTLDEIKDAYEVVGALEGSVILNNFDKIKSSHIIQMEKLNSAQLTALEHEDYDSYYRSNLDFHGVFLSLSENQTLLQMITPFKQRLYDFPRRGYLKEWEQNNCNEHEQFIELIKQKDRKGAARMIRDVHWSFAVQEKFIRRFYKNAHGSI